MASHSTGDGGIPPRDAGKRGLERVMTLGGHYGTRNYTVRDLRDQKGKRVLVETLAFSAEEAAAAEEAGIDTMKVRFDPKAPLLTAEIRRAAPNTFMAFSVPLIAAASPVRRCGLVMTPWRLGQTPSCANGARVSSRRPRKLAFQSKVTPVSFRAGALGPVACAP